MSKITMKYEFGGKGNFLKVQVEESDIQTQHQIKENNREVFELKEKDDLSYKEIAKRKGITRQAVHKHYHTIIKKLCDFYAQYPFFLDFIPILKEVMLNGLASRISMRKEYLIRTKDKLKND